MNAKQKLKARIIALEADPSTRPALLEAVRGQLAMREAIAREDKKHAHKPKADQHGN